MTERDKLVSDAAELQVELRARLGGHVVVGWVKTPGKKNQFVVYLAPGDDVALIPSEWCGLRVGVQRT